MDIVRQQIDKEFEAEIIGGPYDTPPFANFRVSPLGFPKKRGRLIQIDKSFIIS